jgi:DnaJ-class molecular chaperone
VAKPKCEYCQGRGRIWPLVSKPPIPCPQCLGEGVTNANG